MKRSLIIYVIVILVAVLPGVCARASVAGDLSAADGQYKAAQYTQAERSCLMVIQQADRNKAADAEAAFNARKKLALVYIATDRLPQARDAVEQLLSRYAQSESLPRAIHEIVEGAEPLYKVAQVRQLYQDMVTARPGDSRAMWLRMGMAIASVRLTDDQATDAVLQNITTQHGSDARAAEVLNHIAWACRNLKQYNKALTIYQYVVNNWPEKDQVAFAQHGIVICQLGLGNPQEADAALNVLLQKFGKDKNASKMVLWGASGYSDAGEVERASKVFELVVQNYPDTPEAVQAQTALAIRSVQAEQIARIEPTMQALLTKFPPSEAKALGLHNVANTIGWKLFVYANASPRGPGLLALLSKCLVTIANYAQATWPNSDWAMWAERDLATAAIQSGDDAAAEAAIGRLTANYATRKDTPTALHFVGNYYLEGKENSRAEGVYKYLVEKYPNHELMPLVKAGLGQLQIRQGDDQGAEATFQKVLADYASHPRLAEAVYLMAEGYSRRAIQEPPWLPSGEPYLSEEAKSYLRKAAEKWDLIVTTLPVHPSITPSAHYDLATTYYYLGEYPKVEAHCSQLRAGRPADEHAWMTYVLIVKTYQDSLWKGEIRQKDCDAKTKRIYDELVSRYPNCPAAPMVRDWLNRNGRSIEGENK
jgi:TolA-binding protein